MGRIAVIFVAMAVFATGAFAHSTTTRNKETARRVFLEIFNEGKYDVANEIYASDFVNHTVTRDVGLAEDQAAMRGWRAAAPDLVMTVDKEIAEGEYVTVLWSGIGTNTGNGNGFHATGQRMTMRGITIWRIVGGKIREEWSHFSQPTVVP